MGSLHPCSGRQHHHHPPLRALTASSNPFISLFFLRFLDQKPANLRLEDKNT